MNEETGNKVNLVEDCSLKGICKSACPVYEVMLNEICSPRGKSILIKNNEVDKTFYLCTLCGNCSIKCPSNVDLKLRDYRTKVVKQLTTKSNREMIENIRKHGNPYGEIHPGKKPKNIFV